jgi:uncharacterized protein involved in outer membrane biogenesis
MPKALKIALITTGAVVVLIVAAGLFLKMMFPPAKLRAILMPKIEQVVGRQVTVEDFSLKVWTGLGVELKGIELANAKGFADRPQARIASVVLKVNLLGLLRRQLHVTSLVIDRPEILIEKDKAGKFNFDDLVKAAPADSAASPPPDVSTPVSIAVSSFAIRSGSVAFDDRQAGLKVLAGGIEQKLSFSADRKMEDIRTKGSIEIGEITAATPVMSVSRIRLGVRHDVKVDMRSKRVTVNELSAIPQGIVLTMAGQVDSFDTKPVLNLELKTTAVEVKKIFEALPPEIKKQAGGVTASGLIELGLKVTGQVDPKDPKSKPKVEGRVVLKDIGIKYAQLPKSISDVNGDIRFSERDLEVKRLAARLGSAGFELALLVKNFEDPFVKAWFKGSFDLGEVKDYAPLEKGTALAGVVKADFKAEGLIRKTESFNMDGKVELDKLAFATPALLKPVSNMNGTITLTKDLVNIPEISCSIGRSSMSFTGKLKNFLSLVPEQPATFSPSSKQASGQPALALPKQGKASFDFALNSPLLDLDEMLPPPPSASAKAAADKKAAAPAPQMMPLPDLLMDGKVRVAKIVFLKMEFDNLAGNLAMKDRKLSLDGQLGVYSGKVLGNLWADLNDLNRIEYRLKADAQKLEANDFLSALTPFKNRLFAKLDLNGEFSGMAPDTVLVKETLKGQGRAATSEGRLVNWPLLADFLSHTKLGDTKEVTFHSMNLGFRILDQKVFLDDLKMDCRYGEVNLSGYSTFAGAVDYRVSVKLTKEESDKLKGKGGNVAALFTDKDGRVVLDLLVKGQPPKPSVSWDTQMAQARLKGKAQEEIGKAKAEAEAKVKDEADKLKQKADEEAARLKQEAEEKAKKAAEEAAKKLKNLFKKP